MGGIPDASLENEPVPPRHNRHCNPAKDSADESSRIRMVFFGDMHSMAGFTCFKTRYGSPGGLDGQSNIHSAHRNPLRFLHRHYVSKPAYSAAQRQDETDKAHSGVR